MFFIEELISISVTIRVVWMVLCWGVRSHGSGSGSCLQVVAKSRTAEEVVPFFDASIRSIHIMASRVNSHKRRESKQCCMLQAKKSDHNEVQV